MINSRCLAKIVLYKYFATKNNLLNIHFELHNKINATLFVLKKRFRKLAKLFFITLILKFKKKS